MQDPETSTGGADADVEDNTDTESDISEFSETCGCARVQHTVPEVREEVAAPCDHPRELWTQQCRVLSKDNWAPVRDIAPELLSSYPL